MISMRLPAAWLRDLANLVTCCRACNEFLNAYRIAEPVPASAKQFRALIRKHLALKRELALARHAEERAWYAQWRLKVTETS